MKTLAERVLWTFVETFLGVLAVDTVLLSGQVGAVKTAAAAGLAAAVVPVKEFAKRRLAKLKERR